MLVLTHQQELMNEFRRERERDRRKRLGFYPAVDEQEKGSF
jgi:hypothetical protein